MKSKEDVNILFKQGNTDERILKSMAEDTEHEYDSEELSKAMNRSGLVQKEVQVQGKNGQTFTRKQWVKAGEEQSAPKKSTPQEPDTDDKASLEKKLELVRSSIKFTEKLRNDTSSKQTKAKLTEKLTELNKQRVAIQKQLGQSPRAVHPASEGSDKGDVQSKKSDNPTKESQNSGEKQHWTKVGTSQEAKSQIAQMLASGKSREDCMSDFKAQGVTWKEHENPAINWMRAAMAMNRHLTSGEVSQETSESKKEVIGNNSKKPVTIDDIINKINSRDDGVAPLRGRDSISTDPQGKYIYCDKNHDEDNPLSITEEQAVEIYSAYKNKEDYKKIVEKIATKNSGEKSVIGSDYTQLTTEDEAGTPEGEAHNMIVGRLKSMGIKKPTKLDVQQAANDLRDKSIKTIISSYNSETITNNLALANAFGSISNASKLTVERVLKDTLERGSGATREQQCDAISKLCGDGSEYDYESFGDNVAVRASDGSGNPIAVTIEPTAKGLFKVEFVYGDGERSKETYDSISSVKKATESWIKKEEKHTSE